MPNNLVNPAAALLFHAGSRSDTICNGYPKILPQPLENALINDNVVAFLTAIKRTYDVA